MCGKISVSGKVSTQVKLLEQKVASRSSTDKPIARPCVKLNLPATWKSSPTLSTASKKEEPTTDIKHPETLDISGPQISSLLTHVWEPIAIGHHKASYLAALASASTASTTPAAVCGKASSSGSGKISALLECFEDKTETSTCPSTSHLQHSSPMVFTAYLKEELSTTVEAPEISEVNEPKASVLKTHVRPQSSCRYEAALSKVNASSTNPECTKSSVSGKACALVKFFEDKAKMTSKHGPSVKKGPLTSQTSTAKSSIPFKKGDLTVTT